ncbi:hypothetical protein [Hydromonas duriensis]|uniref:Uncharacterized protein n=1 Tax=Hydromonas duriensis TaxID=1527608 RepID=A0A4R6Y2D0_9BURK|nr:hypothetical protein [Hydromonas duriensis]TDR30690.1 hypothetical protein DFR44_11840 [Hydromonas duriensis]
MHSNLGRYDVIKSAFAAYILKGLNRLLPVTPALQAYQQRQDMAKLAVCEDRMVDKAEELLAQYQKTGTRHLEAPLPVVLLAFAKEMSPIAPDRGQSIANPVIVSLTEAPTVTYYKARFDHVEARAQLAYVTHESETARAMVSQMRLYLNAFESHRWPIVWTHNGQTFTTTCSLESYEPMDEPVDVEGRNNLSILVWNLTLNCQMPYLDDHVPVVKQVDYSMATPIQVISKSSTHEPTSGISRWQPYPLALDSSC